MVNDAFETWRGSLNRLRNYQPTRIAFGEVGAGGRLGANLTGRELVDRVSTTAASLRRQGLLPGQRVILSLPASLDFVIGFLSVVSAGGVAVPLPRGGSPARTAMLLPMVSHADAHWVIANDGLSPHLDGLPRLDTSDPTTQDVAEVCPDLTAGAGPQALAFLQYTSGSTGHPKAVEVTHGMLAANLDTIRQAMCHDASSAFVSWLPHFHDMGLVGTVLQPLYCGAQAYLMAPQRFVRQPLDWLRAISTLRATTSGAPNSAYRLCAEALGAAKDSEVMDIDLSSWRVAFNGAEPVQAAAMRHFCDQAARLGFDPRSVYPCYGMAESTLFVSGGPLGNGLSTAPDGTVSCGPEGHGITVRIVDPETHRPCAPGQTGEIWIKGPNVARAYFRDPENSAAFLQARLETGEGPFLRSGDLGEMRDGALFISGRIKEIVILAGRNIHPEDIERVVHDTLGGGHLRVAAFGVPDRSGERLVITLAGVPGSADAAQERVREAVFDALEGITAEVVIAPRNRIPVTSSGKVRRQSARAMYLAAAADTDENQPDRAAAAFAGILGRTLAESDLEKTPLALGLDSLSLLRLVQALDDAGIDPPPLSRLARMSAGAILALSDPATANPEPAWNARTVPARENQKPYVMQELLRPAHPRASFSSVLAFAASPDRLAAALRRTLARHPLLRLRMSAEGYLSEAAVPPGVRIQHAPNTTTARREAANLIRKPLVLFDRAPLDIALISAPDETLLVLRLHHGFFDLYSLGLLFDDLDRALFGTLSDTPSPDYRQAIAEEERYLASAEGAAAISRWKNRLEGHSARMGLGTYPAGNTRLASDVPLLRTALPADQSNDLSAFAAARGGSVYAVLLGAFAAVLSRFAQVQALVIACPFHGRRTARDAATVGLFETLLPLPVTLEAGESFDALVGRLDAMMTEVVEDARVPVSRALHQLADPRTVIQHGFDAMLTLQSGAGRHAGTLARASLRRPGARLSVGDLQGDLIDCGDVAIETALDLCLAQVDGVEGYLAYNPDRIDAGLAQLILTGFETFLAAGIADPEHRVDGLPILPPREVARLQEAAHGPGPWGVLPTAPERFAEVAARWPDAPAVADGVHTLDYAGLSHAVEVLASRLRARDADT